MKALHSGSLDVRAGGPALSMSLTMRGLEHAGVTCVGLCEAPLDGSRLYDPEQRVRLTHRSRFAPFAYVDNITECLRAEPDVDIYHIHGTWMHHGLAVAKYAKRQGKPYVVAPRGMLYPQALAHHALPKRLMMALYQRRVLQEAACVQATCIEEMEHYRALGFTNPVAVLPNPIDISGIIDRPIPEKRVFKVGYLGRIHPRKRIERLIYAFGNLRDELKDSHLVIIGGGDETYMSFLKNEVKRLGLANVEFAGFLSGLEKDTAITELSLLVVPSDFENFGNIVTEALVRGVPVIASNGMPWRELEDFGCGRWIDNDQESIDKAILGMVKTPRERLIEMGEKGKRLIHDNYSVDVLGGKMLSLYKWLAGEGDKPEFVYE